MPTPERGSSPANRRTAKSCAASPPRTRASACPRLKSRPNRSRPRRSDRSKSGSIPAPCGPSQRAPPATIGRFNRSSGPCRRRSKTKPGRAARSIVSCWADWNSAASRLRPKPIATRSSNGCRTICSACRRTSKRSTRSCGTRLPTRTSGWSTGCSIRRDSASGGGGIGSTKPVTPIRTATKKTTPGPTPGAIAIGSSKR